MKILNHIDWETVFVKAGSLSTSRPYEDQVSGMLLDVHLKSKHLEDVNISVLMNGFESNVIGSPVLYDTLGSPVDLSILQNIPKVVDKITTNMKEFSSKVSKAVNLKELSGISESLSTTNKLSSHQFVKFQNELGSSVPKYSLQDVPKILDNLHKLLSVKGQMFNEFILPIIPDEKTLTVQESDNLYTKYVETLQQKIQPLLGQFGVENIIDRAYFPCMTMVPYLYQHNLNSNELTLSEQGLVNVRQIASKVSDVRNLIEAQCVNFQSARSNPSKVQAKFDTILAIVEESSKEDSEVKLESEALYANMIRFSQMYNAHEVTLSKFVVDVLNETNILFAEYNTLLKGLLNETSR